MSTRIGLIIIEPNNTTGSDIAGIVSLVKLSGRKGSASRSIEFTLLDDENRPKSRVNLDLMKGYRCIFSWDGKELFRGVIFKKSQSGDKKIIYKAYDFGIYLSNNKDSFTYENCTLTMIFQNICGRFGIRYSYAYQTEYIIPTISKSKTTPWDILADSMSKQYAATGNRYYIDAEKDYLRLMRRKDNIKQWVIEPGKNLKSFSRSVSLEKTRTRYKLFSNEDSVIAWAYNTGVESAIGVMQEVETTRDTLTEAQARQRVLKKLEELIRLDESLKVDAIGVTDIISGVAVRVSIPFLGINKTYYVDADTHTFTDNSHLMSLTLNRFNDSEYT